MRREHQNKQIKNKVKLSSLIIKKMAAAIATVALEGRKWVRVKES